MSRVIDYYFAPQSPWTYLGHTRLVAIAREAGAMVQVLPIDLNAVFAVSGGVPLAQRPAQRQAYRLVELQRFARHLELPLHLQPAYFPVVPHQAALLIIAVDLHDGAEAALRLAGMVFASVWAQQRNIADPAVLAGLLAECGLPAERAGQAQAAEVQARYEDNTRRAIAAQVFGAPSYVIDGEIFWGQDRLDFVRLALERAAS
ncbi:MAG TPA: 2-hydroxychromene-2-carboxylate isomerase [Roseateles sp.]|nr:2-hydroxychromene-2-carboxylate isomerase [Roseateles sp.]